MKLHLFLFQVIYCQVLKRTYFSAHSNRKKVQTKKLEVYVLIITGREINFSYSILFLLEFCMNLLYLHRGEVLRLKSL